MNSPLHFQIKLINLIYYIIPPRRARIPIANNATIITIGETFFLSNQQHNNVNNDLSFVLNL